jgi:glutamine amidotransferase
MTTVIIDYGSGNLRSAAKAFERAARETGGGTIKVTDSPDEVARADRIVLPGVGAFADCRAGVLALAGMRETLEDAVIARGRPFLGICVGMQLMATRGLEHGVHDGFGWIAGEVAALTPAPGRPVPHMGWNDLTVRQAHPVLAGIEPGAHAYFVHSYAFRAEDPKHVIADTDYGGSVTAVIGRDNMVGTQFHPEKSQETGLRLIANFLSWRP